MVRVAAVFLLILTSTAVAQPRDAGTPLSDAGPHAMADAAAIDATTEPSTAEILAWKAQEIADLQKNLAALDSALAAVQALGPEVIVPPEDLLAYFDLDLAGLADVGQVDKRISALDAEQRALRAAAHDKGAAETALTAQWTPEPDPGTDQARLEKARLQAVALERRILERRAELAAARQRFFERSQPARRAARDSESALHRQLAEDEKRAENERLQAEAARDRALSDQKQASSVAESLISAELARLEGISAEQASFRKTLVRYRQMHSNAASQFERFVESLAAVDPADARYDRVAAELDRLLALGLRALQELWTGPSPAPRPAHLPEQILALSEQIPAQMDRLEERRSELLRAALALDREYRQILQDRAQLFYEQIMVASGMRAELFHEVSAAKRDSLVSISRTTAHALDSEAAQIAARALYWLNERRAQILAAPRLFVDLSVLWIALWWLIELPLVFLLLRFVLRRWDAWMNRLIEAVGTSVHLGGWALFVARMAEFAKSFGPSLLVLLAAVFVYRQLGGAGAPPEIQVLYIFVFWMAAFRFQLRLVTRVVRYLGQRRAERDSEPVDDFTDDFADSEPGEPSREQGKAEDAGKAPGQGAGNDAIELDATLATPSWELFARSWRVVTGYAAVAVIILDLVQLALGRVVLHSVGVELAWWGTLPLAIYCLRVWRPWIVREYIKRSAKDSALSVIARRHSQRFYGVFVLALALCVVLVRQVGRFVQQNLSDLDATKRLLAFLFRRRVEKHAQEHGRVLEKPHDLPRDILEQFPTGPLDPGDRPIKPPFLDQIKDAFSIWQEDKMEGSVALVGGCGMGKSTALRLLESTLGEPVAIIKLSETYTEPGQLIAALARELALPGRPPATEAAFIAEIKNHYAGDERRIIALDNCHNFFLRKVGGFAAWDAFKRIVNTSCDRVFWVLSFNDAAWDYLSNIAGGVAYFRRIVHIPPWTDEELRRMILTRMRRSGYRPNFTDLLVTRLEGVKTSTQIIRTSQGYFRLLWDFTDGNPRVASHFWLRSLVPDTEKRRVKVHLFSSPRIQELERLPDDIAFVLAAVVEHENITAGELATVSNMSPEFCRFALQYCREHGYMWRNPATGRTKLTTHWQQSIIRYLKRRHLLYT